MKYYNVMAVLFAFTISTALVGCGYGDVAADSGNSTNIASDSALTEVTRLDTDQQPKSEESITEEITDAESTESDVQTSKDEISSESDTVETQPLKPREYFPSLSEETLGCTEDFVSELENKLTAILGSDNFILLMTDIDDGRSEDDIVYIYEFKFNDLNLNGRFRLVESKMNPGYLTGVGCHMEGGVWDARFDPHTGENALPTLSSKRVYKSCLCAILSPLAVFENYNSQEEILTRWEDFDSYMNERLKEDPDSKYIGNCFGDDQALLTKESGKSKFFDAEVNLNLLDHWASSSWDIPVTNIWEEED